MYFCENPDDSSEKFGEKVLTMFNSIMKAKKEILKQSIQLKKEEEALRRDNEKKVK